MDLDGIKAIALSVRALSMDAVQKANSGHPGLPMGCAEIGAVLYGEILNINPEEPLWINRDRFVLSAGHGSMLLYSLLHLAGFSLSLEDLKNFRQLGSKTPGHPEYGITPGVETTTGPLGAGFGNAVGMAMAERHLASRFNREGFPIINHFTYVLVGDGCLMEGVSSEAASLAGHLKLGKLIALYDSNGITIEGSTSLAFTEDVKMRFTAYGWQVLEGDAHNPAQIQELIQRAKEEQERPSLLVLKSVIAKGSPKYEGSEKAHGAPLGEEESRAAKKNLGIPVEEDFWIDPQAKSFFEGRRGKWKKIWGNWEQNYQLWRRKFPELTSEWDSCFTENPDQVEWPSYKTGEGVATRSANGAALKAVAAACPGLLGGSADLAPSNNTDLPYGDFSPKNWPGRTIHFGVREHAMGAIVNGLALHGGLRPFGATFLVFSDYMRPAVRLSALMRLPVIYIFTHDSIFVGEDGPTHQPVEHLASLRIIPNLLVFRPADAEETNETWRFLLTYKNGPAAIALTRQKLPVLEKPVHWKDSFKRGAYIVKDSEKSPSLILLATGSEVSLALKAAELLSDRSVRVVSMPCRELFLIQSEEYKRTLLPKGVPVMVLEAGVSSGWEGFVQGENNILSIDRFGESGPGEEVAKHFGLTPEIVLRRIQIGEIE